MSCRILIPEPCHEAWSEMSPADKGWHCASCNKTVVDFSHWSLQNIAAYLRKHSAEDLCGHFNKQQLNVEIPYTPKQWVARVAGTGLSLLQKLALIFLLAFGLLTPACDTPQKEGHSQMQIAAGPDTSATVDLPADARTMGMIAMPDSARLQKHYMQQAKPKKQRAKEQNEGLKGDIRVAPVEN